MAPTETQDTRDKRIAQTEQEEQNPPASWRHIEDEVHRFWECPKWAEFRTKVENIAYRALPHCVTHCGIKPQNVEVDIAAVQRMMIDISHAIHQNEAAHQEPMVQMRNVTRPHELDWGSDPKRVKCTVCGKSFIRKLAYKLTTGQDRECGGPRDGNLFGAKRTGAAREQHNARELKLQWQQHQPNGHRPDWDGELTSTIRCLKCEWRWPYRYGRNNFPWKTAFGVSARFRAPACTNDGGAEYAQAVANLR